jgi:hypothetical protein
LRTQQVEPAVIEALDKNQTTQAFEECALRPSPAARRRCSDGAILVGHARLAASAVTP